VTTKPVLIETEAGWLEVVRSFATLHHWRTYHTRNSKGSDAGFPDLVCVRGPRLVFAELKTEKGRVTREQTLWLDDLAAVGAHVRATLWSPPDDLPPAVIEVFVWRPSDWAEVQRVLT